MTGDETPEQVQLRHLLDLTNSLAQAEHIEPYVAAKMIDAIERQIANRATPLAHPGPCQEGFHWIGQTFDVCENCALPAWEHDGIATLEPGHSFADSPFGAHEWTLRQWQPGEREAIAEKWAATLLDRRRRARHNGDVDRRLCDPAVNWHVTPHRGCVFHPAPTESP